MCFQLISITGKSDIKKVPLLPQLLKSRAYVAFEIVPLQAKLVISLNPSHPGFKRSLWNEKFSLRRNRRVKSQPASEAWFGGDRWSCANRLREGGGRRSKTAKKPQIKVPPGQAGNAVKHSILILKHLCSISICKNIMICYGYDWIILPETTGMQGASKIHFLWLVKHFRETGSFVINSTLMLKSL